MNLEQLNDGLKQAFLKENHRIVFWYDPEQDFEAELSNLNLENIILLNMKNESVFGTKLKLELEDLTNKYLLYFPQEEPEVEKDWLLDIKLYSRSFYADRISIIFNDLGLSKQGMREHLVKRSKFFANKGRLALLKKWVQPQFDEEAIDMAMIATLVKAEDVTLSHILFAIAQEIVDTNTGLETNPTSIAVLEKFGLMPVLISAFQTQLGYPASKAELLGDDTVSYGQFLIRLFLTDFCESLGDVPDWARDLHMPSGSAQTSVYAMASRWRDSTRYYKAFDQISVWVAEAVGINKRLSGFSFENLSQVATFEAIERQIIVHLSEAIPTAQVGDLQNFSEVISNRLDNYWASRHKDDDTRKRYRIIYTALSAAIDLFSLREKYSAGFHYLGCEEIYDAYQKELYSFDLAYRHYMEASLRAHVDIIKTLDEAVEKCYSYWYINGLASNWGDKLNSEDRLSNWFLKNVPQQYNFYNDKVEPLLDRSKKKRIMVIISDAFRYEAAVELKDRINIKRYSKATLGSQLGVVPSYTTLGMASLLPHNSIEYRDDTTDDVFVDGMSTMGITSRNKVLKSYGGIAFDAETVKGWSRNEGREALKNQYLIYVYHNVVDAIGDVRATEDRTFSAVEDAINELSELTHKVLVHFNTSTVLVTADHGFLFQQSKLETADKTSLEDKPQNSIKNKKRYVIGQNLHEPKDALYGSTKNTAGTLSDTKFWVPKGANRFHFVGGARFVHGGVMPQEIVVPVLTVNALRGEKAKQRTKRKVGVISAKSMLKMVNNIQNFELLQTDSISEKMLPVTLSVAIYNDGLKVSSEEIVTFDSNSDSMEERIKKVRLSLLGTDYDRNQDYFLVLKDKDLNTEIERYKVTIDLAFTDDFF